MVDQVAGPGVKDPHQADLSADITRVKRKFLCDFCRSLKEQGVESFLISAHEIAQLGRQGEGQKEIGDIQE
jgi:hypothetical protein